MTDIENAGNAPAEPIKDTIEVVSSTETPEPETSNEVVEVAEKPQVEKPSEESKSSRNQRRRLEKEALIRENAVKEERLRTLEAEVSKYRQPQKEVATPENQEPKVTDYEDVWEYNKALIDYKTGQGLKTFQKEQAESAKQQQAHKAYEEISQAYVEKLRPILEAKPEIAERLEQYEQAGLITKHLENAVMESSLGDKITEYLYDKPDAIRALSQMSEAQTYKAIGILEAQLYGSPEKQVTSVTQARPPIKPPGNTAKTDRSINSYTQEEIEEMPISEYKKLTNMK